MHTRSFVRSSAVHATLAVAALLAVAPAAGAQYSVARYPSTSRARQLFVWEGRVDREIQLVVRDDRLFVRPLGSNEDAGGSTRLFSALPRQEGYLRLERVDGRGTVEVLEQPTAGNGYRAVVRLTDPRSGAGSYRVAAYWEPAWSGSGRGRSDDGRYDGHDDGRYDRRRDRDRDGGYRRRATGTMRWSGDVDALTQIQIRDRRVTTTTLRGQPTRDVFTRVDGAPLFGDDVRLSVSVREGRGTVTVVQQPSASNDYTAVVRVSDRAAGFGHYEFDLTWR